VLFSNAPLKKIQKKIYAERLILIINPKEEA